MKKQTYYLIGSSTRNKRWIYLVFFGILAFILIFFPFYAINMRYQVGYIFQQIVDGIGYFSLTIGTFLVAISIISLFLGGRRMNTRLLIIGVVLLWIGCWVTGSVFSLFDVTIGNERPPSGYH